MKNNYFLTRWGGKEASNSWKRVTQVSLTLVTLLIFTCAHAWGAEATILSASGNALSAYYLAPDGTAISAIAGAGAKSASYNKGSKITVDGKNNPNATITFTIASGVTITSFQVTGTKQNNTTYDLDGTSVTFGTALTGLSKTSSMTFRLHCTDAASSSSNRNTIITSIALTYTSAPSCTAPNHVDVSGRWDRFGGETISLTATAYSSAGTGSPIADGDITGWQWQKLVSSTWTNVSNGTVDGVTTSGATTKNLQIANCGLGNSGKYRCVVSTGATCSTASATATDGTEGFGVKVYVLECYTGGTTVYNFTRDGENQAGSLTIDLAANTNYEFKFHADNDYYGNNGTISTDATNWVCSTSQGNLTIYSGLGGTFTIAMEYSTGGNSSVEGEPEISVTYPRKKIYMACGDWKNDNAKMAVYYWRGDVNDWTDDFMSTYTCDDNVRYTTIPAWAQYLIFGRFDKNKTSTGNWDDIYNQSCNISPSATYDLYTFSDWSDCDSKSSFTNTNSFSETTFTISYNKGTSGTGTKSSETKTCDVAFTLPSSAVFTREGYSQTGWTTSDGGAQTHALGGSYTTNDDQTFYPVWTVQSYNLTWNLGGGTTTSAGTGIGSGVSSNTTTSQAFGTALTAPTVTKANYDFSAWSPSVASTMPAAATTYTATWTAQTHDVSFSLTNAAYSSGTDEGEDVATYGTNYSVTFAADDGFVFPSDITVQIGGVTKTKGTHYTWNASTGTLVVTGSYITGDIAISFAAIEDVLHVTYDGGSPTSGSAPEDDNSYDSGDEVTVLGKNTLSKSGYTFCGWSYNGYVYVEGDKFNITESATLTAVWNQNATTVTLTHFATSQSSSSKGVPDDNSKYLYGYKGSMTDANAVTLTTSNTNTKGQNSGVEIRVDNSATLRIYADKTTNATPATFTNVTCVAFDAKLYNSGSNSRTQPYTVKVGGTSVGTGSVTGLASDGYQAKTTGTFAAKNGHVEIVLDNTGSSNTNLYVDNIAITYSASTYKKVTFNKGSGPSTVSGLPTDRYVPSGSKIAEPSTDPSAANYIFEGWVTISGGSTPFNFASTAITSDKTIYAKWKAKTSPGSGTVNGTTSICSGSNTNVTLSTSVLGASYKLYKGGAEVADSEKAGTGSALTWSVSEAGSYTVKAVETATHASGNMSGSATISIYTALSKTTDPTSSQNATVGVGCALSGLTYAGNANVAFQWQTCTDATPSSASDITSGSQYSNYNTATMTFTPASTGTYYFRCVVSDDCGSSFNTSVVTVTAKVAPTIYSLTGEPTAICSDATATLTLSGSDDGVTYKLYKGGVDQSDDKVGDGNEITWTVSAAGSYTVKTVADATYAEATMSGTVTISITTATSITTQPATSPTGHDGVSVTLGSGMAVAGASISYKWYSYTSSGGEGEAVIAGATSATYAVTKSTGTYYYKVEVIGTCGSVKSDMITLTVDNKHQLTYNANGGSGAPSATYVAPGSTTLSNTKPTKTNYRFLGWNTKDDGTGDHYDAGASYTMGSTAVTLYAEWGETATLTWTLTIGTGASSVSTSEKNSTNGTRISKSNMSNLLNNGLTITNNSKSDYTVKIEAPSSKDDDKYMYVTFVVADDYEIVPSAVTATFQPVNAAASADMILSDTHGHSISLLGASCSKGNGNEKTITNGSGVAFSGTVTLKIYCYGSSVNTYRLGSTITITGAINYICPERPTIVKPASAKALNVYADESKTLSVEVETYNSGALTYQWKKDGANIAGANSATYTVVGSTLTVGTTYAYTCDVTEEGACASVTSPAFNVKAASPNCGYNEIANAVLTAKNSATTSNATALYLNMSNSSAPYKLDKTLPSYFGLQLSSGNFQVGDSIIFKVKIGDMDINGGSTYPVAFYHTTDTSSYTTSNLIYTSGAQTKNTDNVYIRFIVTQAMIDAGLTNKILIIRSGRVAQNHSMYEARIKRYTCPDVVMFDANTDSNWGTKSNWVGATGRGAGLPTSDVRALITKPATVNTKTAVAKSVVINTDAPNTGKLTIANNGVLTVDGTITAIKSGAAAATAVSDVVIDCGETSQGALIFEQPTSGLQTKGTVNIYTKTSRVGGKLQWQYMGYPFNSGTDEDYDGYYINKYSETQGGWIVMRDQGDRTINAWDGLAIAGDGAGGAQLQGTFVPTTGDKELTLTYTSGKGKGKSLIGNSWTAPIQILEMEEEDFGGARAAVYVFNTGRYGSKEVSPSGSWVTLAIDAVKAGVDAGTWTNLTVIPAFQGFQVKTAATEDKTLTLNYDKHVRPATDVTAMNEPLRAPARREQGEIRHMRLTVESDVAHQDVFLFEGPEFSEDFDNGWDGDYMGVSGQHAYLYVVSPRLGKLAIAAENSLEGRIVALQSAAEKEYTFTFAGNGMGYYLNDLKTQTSTLIQAGNSYTFNYENGDDYNRFMISVMPFGGMPSGLDEISGKSDKVQKVIYKDHVYIIRGGKIYGVDGTTVK